MGYYTIALPLRERKVFGDGGYKKVVKEKGLDCEIVYDMAILSRTGEYKSFVLVAGDEDYARTVKRIHGETGVDVTVAFFKHAGCSSILIDEATSFIDLSHYVNSLFREGRQERCLHRCGS